MFSWLTDNIVSYIINTFNSLVTNIEDLTLLAQKSPSQFNPEIWNALRSFNHSVVLPIAYLVFGCFIMADFIKILTKQNPNGIEAMHMVLVVVIKMVIGEAILTNIPEIIDAIFGIVSEMLKANTLQASNYQLNPAAISDALEQENSLSLFGIWFQCLFISGINNVCRIMASLIIKLRYIEIYVFTAVAALPAAVITSSSHEISSIGYSFIKRMCALALQVVFIMVCFMMYVAIARNGALTISDGSIVTDFWSIVGNSILLVIALFQTGTWSKSLFGVH